ncbi:sperm-associated microtubule inner protein 10 [Petromyzon marinus]|uniref:sperm-associated microtubule inner protein 10 n=1 Tax=Petromyzon marinus TaxID=7757 RepID=UPI003F728904
MADVATARGKSRCSVEMHTPKFTSRHPLMPQRYVMPWKQDMKNRALILENAKRAGLYWGPHEESLFFDRAQRLCHGQGGYYVEAPFCLTMERSALLEPSLHSPLSRHQTLLKAWR